MRERGHRFEIEATHVIELATGEMMRERDGASVTRYSRKNFFVSAR